MGIETTGRTHTEETIDAAPATPALDTSKKALHRCLNRIKAAKSESDLRRLADELQRIVFQRQYRDAQD